MSQDEYATVTIPVDSICESHGCDQSAEYAFIVTGAYGRDGIAVYCDTHAQSKEQMDNATPAAEVDS